MSDLISRQAAIDALADYIHNVDRVYSTGKLTHEDCMDAAHSVLDKLPPAQQWTLCSERLPKEEEQSYWVCTEDGYQKQCRWKRYEGKDCYIYAWHSTLKVIAWMPLPQLPQPWEGEKHGTSRAVLSQKPVR